MKLVHATIGIAAFALAGCNTYGNDQGARYLQRIDTVTMSSGDASRTNVVAQTLHPWPPGVGDRRIPMQGTRAARAMDCYKQGAGQELVADQKGRAPNQQNIAGGGGSASGGGAAQLKC